MGTADASFAAGGLLDRLPPGPALAGFAARAIDDGANRLDDDQLIGVLAAARRVASWAAALEADAVGELLRRREATGEHREVEYLGDEVAAALTMTVRAGNALVGFAAELTRLPATRAALRGGLIDRIRAGVIADELSVLDPARATAVEQLIIGAAPGLTSGQLRERVRRAVLAADPTAADRRRKECQRDARVELVDEQTGTASLSGRDLPTAAALAADGRVDAEARELKAVGSTATLPQLRAAVFLARLAGQDVTHMLEAILGTSSNAPMQYSALVTRDGHSALVTQDGQSALVTQDGHSAFMTQDGTAPSDEGPEPSHGHDSGIGSNSPVAHASPAGVEDGLTVRGSVHLTIPLTTWLDLSAAPGEIAGFGPANAATCRELADRLAASGGSRWCVTLTDQAGRAVAHGCARRPPPDSSLPGKGGHASRAGPANPGGPKNSRSSKDLGDKARWLAEVRISPIENGVCSHAREVAGYRIPASLHHIVKVRQRTCSFPGCRRAARRCDDDHTLPHDQGGRTCECNLAPLCRRHHQAKQGQRWHLDQPAPGVLVWRLPHGRRYTVTPGIYPI